MLDGAGAGAGLEPMLLDEPLVLEPAPLVLPPTPVLPEVLAPLEVPPAPEGEDAASFRHCSFSRPVSVSQRAVLVALLLVEGEVLLEVLGVLGVAEGVDEELEPADGLELEPLEVCPNDAADIANSAAAVAVTRIFNVMGFSCMRVEKRKLR